MMRFKLKGPGLFFLLISLVGLLFLFSGCGQSDSTSSTGSSDSNTTTESTGDPYALYNKVELGQTKEEVDENLGITPEELASDIYIYTDEDGYSVSVSFSTILSDDNSNEVLTKMIYGSKTAEYISSVGKENEITEEQAAQITEGMTYDEVKTILGSDGIEQTMSGAYGGGVTVNRIWMKDGIISGLVLEFSGTEGSSTVDLIVSL
jgi:outer membrane protein assembly factor BamE (lipoprotein component of BamABCDE complex)